MARRRLIIHGSQEELEMFEPIYNTRLRLQHGASTSRFQLPDPTPGVESEQEVEDEGAVTNIQTAGQEGNEVAVDTACWRSSDNEESNDDSVPNNVPRSTSLTEDQVVFANNDNTGLQGNGSQTPAPASSDSDTDTDSASDSDS